MGVQSYAKAYSSRHSGTGIQPSLCLYLVFIPVAGTELLKPSAYVMSTLKVTFVMLMRRLSERT